MTTQEKLAKDSDKFYGCDKRYSFYCFVCFGDTPIDCYCNKIIGYDPKSGIPIVNLTAEKCQYLSKFVTDKKENDI